MAPLTVGIVGAAGETGKSITDALLQEDDVHLVALVRSSSLEKPSNLALQSRGVELRPLDLATGDIPSTTASLKDIEILISAIGPSDQHHQIPLATAAKDAGVRRFFPCAAMPVVPAGGVHWLRDEKEKVFRHVKKIGLSYTIVDVGWWYQIAWPRVPSGKLDAYTINPSLTLTGTGDVPSALTDLRDIGRYFARLIRDDRTIDEYVLVYDELWTQHQIWDTLSSISGEDIPRRYTSAQQLESAIAEAQTALQSNPEDGSAMLTLWTSQYAYSWGVRGDNTPARARALGYVTSKELYPEMRFTTLEEYLGELVAGEGKGVYEEKSAAFVKGLAGKGRE